jgi:hypothetical protein
LTLKSDADRQQNSSTATNEGEAESETRGRAKFVSIQPHPSAARLGSSDNISVKDEDLARQSNNSSCVGAQYDESLKIFSLQKKKREVESRYKRRQACKLVKGEMNIQQNTSIHNEDLLPRSHKQAFQM